MTELEKVKGMLVRLCKWNSEIIEASIPLEILNWYLEEKTNDTKNTESIE